MAYTTIEEQIWKASSSNWYVNLVYQYQQNDDSGVSDIKILGFKFYKIDSSGNSVGGTQSCQIKCNNIDTGVWTVSSPAPSGTYTHEWYTSNPINTSFACDDNGNTVFDIYYKCWHSATNTRVPHLSDWQTLTVTLPKLSERAIFMKRINGQWWKGELMKKINGHWYKGDFEKKINSQWYK